MLSGRAPAASDSGGPPSGDARRLTSRSRARLRRYGMAPTRSGDRLGRSCGCAGCHTGRASGSDDRARGTRGARRPRGVRICDSGPTKVAPDRRTASRRNGRVRPIRRPMRSEIARAIRSLTSSSDCARRTQEQSTSWEYEPGSRDATSTSRVSDTTTPLHTAARTTASPFGRDSPTTLTSPSATYTDRRWSSNTPTSTSSRSRS